jgi:hypothetical protein
MVDFINSKVKIYHKIELKEMSHKIVVPQHFTRSNTQENRNNFSYDPLKRAQELKNHYHSHFVQNCYLKSSNIFYNYCCKVGHISVECQFRKGNNNTSVV